MFTFPLQMKATSVTDHFRNICLFFTSEQLHALTLILEHFWGLVFWSEHFTINISLDSLDLCTKGALHDSFTMRERYSCNDPKDLHWQTVD